MKNRSGLIKLGLLSLVIVLGSSTTPRKAPKRPYPFNKYVVQNCWFDQGFSLTNGRYNDLKGDIKELSQTYFNVDEEGREQPENMAAFIFSRSGRVIVEKAYNALTGDLITYRYRSEFNSRDDSTCYYRNGDTVVEKMIFSEEHPNIFLGNIKKSKRNGTIGSPMTLKKIGTSGDTTLFMQGSGKISLYNNRIVKQDLKYGNYILIQLGEGESRVFRQFRNGVELVKHVYDTLGMEVSAELREMKYGTIELLSTRITEYKYTESLLLKDRIERLIMNGQCIKLTTQSYYYNELETHVDSIIKMTEAGTNKKVEREIYAYEANGNMHSSYRSINNIKATYKYPVYDARGNWLVREGYKDGILSWMEKRNIEYFEN